MGRPLKYSIPWTPGDQKLAYTPGYLQPHVSVGYALRHIQWDIPGNKPRVHIIEETVNPTTFKLWWKCHCAIKLVVYCNKNQSYVKARRILTDKATKHAIKHSGHRLGRRVVDGTPRAFHQ